MLASLLLTVAVFTFVLLLGDALKEILGLLINGQVKLGIVVEAIVLLVPFMMVFALPMGLLTATLLVFGRFSADQELTAARASGVSLLSLIAPILILSLVCCGFSAWINLKLGPQCRVAFKNLMFNIEGNLASAQLPEGRFIRDFPGYIVYVGKNHKGDLKDITIFVLENKTNPAANVSMTITAPNGDLQLDKTNKQMFLHLIEPRCVSIQGRITSTSDFLSDNLYPTNSSAKQLPKPKISDMTFNQLQNEMKELEGNFSLPLTNNAASPAEKRAQSKALQKMQTDSTEPVRIEMHWRIALSFACFGFALVGIPLGIRVHRRETNVGFAMALILAAVYFSFMLVGKSLSSHPEWSPHLIFWIPNFIFQAVGAVLLWRANRGI